MKNITIAGALGKDAVTRHTQGGDAVTSWTVAVEDRQGQEKSTIWFDCSMWGKRGETLAQYLTKGSKVTLAGDLGKREHEGKTYLTIRVDQLTLMGGKPQGDEGGSYGGRSDPARQAPASQGSAMDDEIPFAPQVL
jgi:single-strand DNA-binding protein